VDFDGCHDCTNGDKRSRTKKREQEVDGYRSRVPASGFYKDGSGLSFRVSFF
jgi:hypothetical protein